MIRKKCLKKPTKDNASKFNKWVNEKETECFDYQRPIDMLKDLYRTNDKYKSNDLVSVIKRGSSDLKNETEYISEEEKKNWKTK